MEFTIGTFKTLQSTKFRARAWTPKGNNVTIPGTVGKTRKESTAKAELWMAAQGDVAQALLSLMNAKRKNAPLSLDPISLDQL